MIGVNLLWTSYLNSVAIVVGVVVDVIIVSTQRECLHLLYESLTSATNREIFFVDQLENCIFFFWCFFSSYYFSSFVSVLSVVYLAFTLFLDFPALIMLIFCCVCFCSPTPINECPGHRSSSSYPRFSSNRATSAEFVWFHSIFDWTAVDIGHDHQRNWISIFNIVKTSKQRKTEKKHSKQNQFHFAPFQKRPISTENKIGAKCYNINRRRSRIGEKRSGQQQKPQQTWISNYP